ncbi:IS66 family transposase [Caenispirillum bisanense]|uniref:Transposase n=1 Tax=Caenispirillum bisanense TaxID=414052 RepID=A0A286H236_9PROT|nr:IS66 family transposase [Caenispirillum bisanense]SOE01850.1 Transposase [Caenispirillum bisanense]
MPLDLDTLPTDPADLRRLVLALAEERDVEKDRADRLEHLLVQLKRLMFGRRSEKLDPNQLALAFEDLEQSIAAVHAEMDAAAPVERRRRRTGDERASLPKTLPEIERVIDVAPEDKVCPCCKGERHVIGEDVSRRLDVVPVQYRILVTRRPRYGCRTCETGVVQAPAPDHVVAGGLPTEALIAQVLVGKYADGLPLYRQARILARQGIEIDRSVLAGWVGHACWWLKPLYERLRLHLLSSAKLYADETRLPVLDPGRGRTKTCQLWAYARDDRPWGGGDPPAVAYVYAAGRAADHARDHLSGFAGVLQVDGYAAYKSVVTAKAGAALPLPITLAFCWSHLRRKFYELHVKQGSPVAAEALRRIAELYRIESEIRGRAPEERQAARAERTRPLVESMRTWIDAQLARVSGKAPLAEILRYAVNHWDGLCLFLDDGRVEMDSNAVERCIRPVTLVRKNSLFAGSDGGGDHWAIVASLIETAKLNGVEPFAYLKSVLETIVMDFPASRLDELLPWNWKAAVNG